MRFPTPNPSPGRGNLYTRESSCATLPRAPKEGESPKVSRLSMGRGHSFSRNRPLSLRRAHPRTPWEREGESVVALAQDSLQRPHESGGCLRSRLGVPPYAEFSTRKDLHKVAVYELNIGVSLAKRGTPRHLLCHPPKLGGLSLQPAHPRTPWEREGESVVALAKTDEPSQISRPSLGKGWGWGLASFEKKYWAHTQ